MSGRRTIVVTGREWKYRVGMAYVVAKATDTGEGRRISLNKLTGMDNHEIERAMWKHSFHVTPSQIADWLSRK
jgi:hypothetical protein